MVAPLDEFFEARVEQGDVLFPAFQDEFVAAGGHLQFREIGTELVEDAAACPVDLDRVNGFQEEAFLHLCRLL